MTISGTGSLRGNASPIDIAGNLTGTSGFFVPGTSTVTLDGSAGQIVGGPGAITFYNLAASGPGRRCDGGECLGDQCADPFQRAR